MKMTNVGKISASGRSTQNYPLFIKQEVKILRQSRLETPLKVLSADISQRTEAILDIAIRKIGYKFQQL
jgi:hypothetical protein